MSSTYHSLSNLFNSKAIPSIKVFCCASWTSAVLDVIRVHGNNIKPVYLKRIKLNALTWSLCFLRQYTSQTKYNSTFIFSDNLGKYFKFRILQLILFLLSGPIFFYSLASILYVKKCIDNIGTNKTAKHSASYIFSPVALLEKLKPCFSNRLKKTDKIQKNCHSYEATHNSLNISTTFRGIRLTSDNPANCFS